MNFISQKDLKNRGIAIWVCTLTIMVLLMILIGGLTRLTDSGLSMVDWKPLMGTLPPLSYDSWIKVFEKYKLSPEYLIINKNMSLNEFKFIFWWEWGHRFFARLIGLVFLFPFLFFILKKSISKNLIMSMFLIFIFGLFQAVVGWWMVKSGLSDDPHVSAYRLSFHLTNALIIYCILFWISLSLICGYNYNIKRSSIIKKFFLISLFLVFITIVSGGFMAGTDAGKSFNTFPLMGDNIIPDEYFISEYGWLNSFENTIAINFNHRWLASFTFLFIFFLMLYLLIFKNNQYNNLSLVLVLIFLSGQFLLGILTLIYGVPILFASMHQTNSILLMSSILFAYHKILYKGK